MAQPKGNTRSKMEGARSGDPLRPRLRSVIFILRVKGITLDFCLEEKLLDLICPVERMDWREHRRKQEAQ